MPSRALVQNLAQASVKLPLLLPDYGNALRQPLWGRPTSALRERSCRPGESRLTASITHTSQLLGSCAGVKTPHKILLRDVSPGHPCMVAVASNIIYVSSIGLLPPGVIPDLYSSPCCGPRFTEGERHSSLPGITQPQVKAKTLGLW